MAIVSTPITSYIGSRYNKARIISICAILYAIGCGLFTLPFFFGGRYSLIKPSQLALRNMSTSNTLAAEASLNSSDYYDLCKSNIITNVTNLVYNTRSGASERVSAEDTCSRNQTLYQWPFIVFILAQLLLSWGAAPLLPLGITYMTENLEKKKKNPSLYTGKTYFYYSKATNKCNSTFKMQNQFIQEIKKKQIKYIFCPNSIFKVNFRWALDFDCPK